jgi:3-phenylpropionate/cinnamic acid dioxygenase small subunit
MNDETAIANLVFRYAELIDSGDFDGIGSLFADAVITAEGSDVEWRGAEAITAMYVDRTRRYDDDGTPKSKHVTTNLIIEVDDGCAHATCRSYYTVLQRTDELPLQPIVAGRYRDEFARVDGTWRFTHRHMLVDLVGDLSQHLLFDLRGPTH